MTDPVQPTPQSAPQTAPPAPGRGLKIALAISVALNLAVAGLAFGAWLHGGPWRGMGHDMSLGPFSEALSPEDRQALRQAVFADRDAVRAGRDAARAEFARLLAALRADPYDPASTDAALAAIVTRTAGRLEKGQALLQARIEEMSPDDRRAFADRLETALNHGPRG